MASHLNTIPGVVAERPKVGTDYSDVLVNYNSSRAWIEVKMHHKDNLANPRVYYHQNTWKTRYSTPVAGIIVDLLNKSETALDFVYKVCDYGGYAFEQVYIPTNRSEMGAENAVCKNVMRSFCKSNGAYVIDYQGVDISSAVVSHYTRGKTEPAYYMQAGDDFYLLSNTNPLGLSKDIPEFSGVGKMRVRVSNRSKFYEVQAEIKVQQIASSQYSILPNTSKVNPFCSLPRK